MKIIIKRKIFLKINYNIIKFFFKKIKKKKKKNKFLMKMVTSPTYLRKFYQR